MKRTGFIYDDLFLNHRNPAGHPERGERLIAIINALKSSGLADGVEMIRPEKAGTADIEMVHTPGYVQRLKDSPPSYLDPDTYLSDQSFDTALYAAGAVITAIRNCKEGEIENAFCAVRPPGHHAESDRAMGFCLFNNIAVGARFAQKSGYRKVFIADFDVHHGNGTEHMFYEDDTVFYFSTHQYPHYPGTGSEKERGRGKGEGFTFNITMASGSGDDEYKTAYIETLPELARGFDPDIILVSAGYDIHISDPLSSIRVTDEGIREIVRGILDSKKGIPYVFTLEGGYDLGGLSRGVAITIEEMMRD